MAPTATLPSARRHCHQTALLNTALVKTALSPCERRAGVSPFGFVYSEVFEWIKSSSLRVAAGTFAREIQSVLTMQGQSEPGEGKPAMDEDQKNSFFCKGIP